MPEEITDQEIAQAFAKMLIETNFNIPARMAANYVLMTAWLQDIASGKKVVIDAPDP